MRREPSVSDVLFSRVGLFRLRFSVPLSLSLSAGPRHRFRLHSPGLSLKPSAISSIHTTHTRTHTHTRTQTHAYARVHTQHFPRRFFSRVRHVGLPRRGAALSGGSCRRDRLAHGWRAGLLDVLRALVVCLRVLHHPPTRTLRVSKRKYSQLYQARERQHCGGGVYGGFCGLFGARRRRGIGRAHVRNRYVGGSGTEVRRCGPASWLAL